MSAGKGFDAAGGGSSPGRAGRSAVAGGRARPGPRRRREEPCDLSLPRPRPRQAHPRGARKEREVVVYTSLNLKDSVPITEAFEKKTGVHVQLWRSSSEKVLQRAVAEARAGRFACDILETNGPEMEAMYREQLLEEFYSPNFADLPAAAFPKHHHYVADRFNFFTIAYNTKLVKSADVPGSLRGPAASRLRRPRGAGGERCRLVRRHGEGDGEQKGLAFSASSPPRGPKSAPAHPDG